MTRQVGEAGRAGTESAGTDLRVALTSALRRLAAAGVTSPRADAEQLAAHVLSVARSRLPVVDPLDGAALARFDDLVGRRAAREPLQHLLGTAALGPVEPAVGPGVFVPRPETELLLEWGLGALRARRAPTVVDLCAGSGALALAVARERPDAAVHAVEADPAALAWLRHNAAGTAVTVHEGDVTAPDVLAELDGRVDLVLCNPPYVPAATAVPPEVACDPAVAVFAGVDGLAVIRPTVTTVRRLLCPGGALAVEHDETHADAVLDLLAGAGLVDRHGHADLTGRPRFATATRS